MKHVETIHQLFATHLIEKIQDRLSYRNQDILSNKTPDDNIYLGAFSEIDAKQNENGIIFPNHIGIQFKIDLNHIKDSIDLNLDFLCDFFYRISPSYEEQSDLITHFYKSETGIDEEKTIDLGEVIHKKFINFFKNSSIANKELSSVKLIQIVEYMRSFTNYKAYIDALSTRESKQINITENKVIEEVYQTFLHKELGEVGLSLKKNELAYKYKKYAIKDFPSLSIRIEKTDSLIENIFNNVQQFNETYNNLLHDEITQIKDLINVSKKPRIKDILSEEAFMLYLYNSKQDDLPYPNWKVKVDIDTILHEDSLYFDVTFSNQNKFAEKSINNIQYPYSTKIFNSKIIVSGNRVEFNKPIFDKFEITDLLSSYRYDVQKICEKYKLWCSI